MLIDCDTCTVRGQGCDDCVVTVLLGAPPGWRGSDPTVVPMTPRAAAPGSVAGDVTDDESAPGGPVPAVVELDEVERRAVRALADFGLVPPLRHQEAPTTRRRPDDGGTRHVS